MPGETTLGYMTYRLTLDKTQFDRGVKVAKDEIKGLGTEGDIISVCSVEDINSWEGTCFFCTVIPVSCISKNQFVTHGRTKTTVQLHDTRIDVVVDIIVVVLEVHGKDVIPSAIGKAT